MASIIAFANSFTHLAVSGSRVSGSKAVASAAAILHYISSYSGQVAVGCASGVDAAVRYMFPHATVFSVQSYKVNGSITRASFAWRSTHMVQWLAANHGLLIAFPSSLAPGKIQVGTTFSGHGSGTWGTIALAIGLGCSVMVVLPASSYKLFWASPSIASYFRFIGQAPCGGYIWLCKF